MPAITIDLSDEMYSKLASVAVQQTASVEDVVVHALEEKVRETDEARVMARRHYTRFQHLFDRLKE